MPRPRNPAHREALLAAATRVVATQGLSATTAAIATEAGVSAGTLFVHFASKPVLVDRLFVALKSEMGAAAASGLAPQDPPLQQLHQLWSQWLGWAISAPEKRAALAHLEVAEEVTDASRQAVHLAFGPVSELLERCRAGGPMQDVPLAFVLRILSAIADAVIDDLIQRPATGGAAADDPRSEVAFAAIRRAIAG